jgi:hypothetical protein
VSMGQDEALDSSEVNTETHHVALADSSGPVSNSKLWVVAPRCAVRRQDNP